MSLCFDHKEQTNIAIIFHTQSFKCHHSVEIFLTVVEGSAGINIAGIFVWWWRQIAGSCQDFVPTSLRCRFHVVCIAPSPLPSQHSDGSTGDLAFLSVKCYQWGCRLYSGRPKLSSLLLSFASQPHPLDSFCVSPSTKPSVSALLFTLRSPLYSASLIWKGLIVFALKFAAFLLISNVSLCCRCKEGYHGLRCDQFVPKTDAILSDPSMFSHSVFLTVKIKSNCSTLLLPTKTNS